MNEISQSTVWDAIFSGLSGQKHRLTPLESEQACSLVNTSYHDELTEDDMTNGMLFSKI